MRAGSISNRPRAGARDAVRVVQVEDGARLDSPGRDAQLPLCISGAPPLGLHGPEDTGCGEPPDHGEDSEVGQAPRRAEEARDGPRGAGNGVVALHDLALGLSRTAEPEAPVAPGVIAQLMALVDDAPGDLGRRRGSTADQEERRGDAFARQDVQDPRRMLAIGTVVEGERGEAFGPAPAPDGSGVDHVGAPRVRGPQRGRGGEPERGVHDGVAGPLERESAGRFATSNVSLPCWTSSPRWFKTLRSSMTTPPSFNRRLATLLDTE